MYFWRAQTRTSTCYTNHVTDIVRHRFKPIESGVDGRANARAWALCNPKEMDVFWENI